MLRIDENRRAQKYSRKEQGRRILWAAGKLAFRLTPRPLHRLRAAMLRAFGAKVGAHVHVYPEALVYFPWNLEIGDWSAVGERALIYNLGRVKIGSRSTISHGAHICAGTHDYRQPSLPLLKPPIDIGDDVWIAADAFVGPGVTVGDGAVVGARAVVIRDVPSGMVVAGNPACVIKSRHAASALPEAVPSPSKSADGS